MLSLEQIQRILPQAYPFLMIDRVSQYEKGLCLRAHKKVTINEWSCTGFLSLHDPIQEFPRTLLIEIAAQAALILYHLSMPSGNNSSPQYLLGKLRAEFLGEIALGDEITVQVRTGKMVSSGGICEAEVFTDGMLRAKVQLILGVKQASNQ